MHLAELLTLGARPGAGLMFALTGRCPLSCAHCSTDSTMGSPQFSGEPFRRLVDSFEADAGGGRPDALLLSGGEPLLRPTLVRDLVRGARRAGTRTALLTGMFFARGGGRVPPAVRAAAAGLDHLAASVDAAHEREVGRSEVFAALSELLELVPAVSLHITAMPGRGAEPDPYTEALVAEVRARFGDRVPMLVGAVRPTGRAAALLPPGRAVEGAARDLRPMPCPFAAWPLVDVDGRVYACTRQSLVRTEAPAHLALGQASRDSWRTLRARLLGDPVLRSVRMLGPVATGERFADAGGVPEGADPCSVCLRLSTGGTAARAAAHLRSEGGARTEAAVATLLTDRPPRLLATARGALARYAHLTELGWSGEPCRNS
ncbi:radical SAM protein [Streptacidiphilus rugosus]|uniref:radical SAM protein n=1 Tax=Streptacidiphilus rugosus TaxID=405783 RepID=UPI00068E88F8|nr:radical SAM protein [Streptacidiphilus rugosus]